jgi:RES domain-containing protein
MMVVHRIAHQSFAGDLEGTGAKKFGGRWNPQGIPCLYCSAHLSLAILEKFVHAQARTDMISLATIQFKIPTPVKLYQVDVAKLEKGWETNIPYTQWLGQQILEDLDYAGFIIPSIIVPVEDNIVLNPLSPAFKKIIPGTKVPFHPDLRLLNQLHEG